MRTVRVRDAFADPLLAAEPTPLTPNERIENWRRKLLDLTLPQPVARTDRATLQTVPIARVELPVWRIGCRMAPAWN
jgi:hypothetical protein